MNISGPFIRRPIANIAHCRRPARVRTDLLLQAAGRRATAGGCSDHPDQCRPAGGQPRNHGVECGHAPGATALADHRHHADDLEQHPGVDFDHPAVRPRPQHRRAAQDVQSAINAAGGQLPNNLPSPPTLRKVNPADNSVLILP